MQFTQHLVSVATLIALLLVLVPAAEGQNAAPEQPPKRHTQVSIQGEQFWINGQPTYAGRTWKGQRIEGLLFNARLVQGIFDDLNPDTRANWIYPDTKTWDAERNTKEFIAAMPAWKRHELLAFTLNLQGGSPYGYSSKQPWLNSALTEDGDLRPEYMHRLERILNRADELGMVVILGIFYFGQEPRLKDDKAVIRSVDNTLNWLLERDYRNVLIEINNECDQHYKHAMLQPERVSELIERVARTTRNGRRFLVSTSYGGGSIPGDRVLQNADFVLLHGNGVGDPQRIIQMVQQTRARKAYRPMPIVFNEDDHFDFEKPQNNMAAALSAGASWGYFDYRMKDEGFENGFQSVPVDWSINSARKRAFFDFLSQVTGQNGAGENGIGQNIIQENHP